MHVTPSIKTIRAYIQGQKKEGKKVGFVPTMGALHQGHLSLIQQCKKECDVTILSIFVNPAQFDPREDFHLYPRPRKNDLALARASGVDMVFLPSTKSLYQRHHLTSVLVADITEVLCGKSRPTHFRGVTTIVAKLLNIIQPHRLYLGQKDAQQCLVIKQMIKDLNFDVRVKICPTVRERDGLALSSRNVYLNPQQRREAPVLYQALRTARKMIKQTGATPSEVSDFIKKEILKKTRGQIDYIACVDAQTLRPPISSKGRILIALAIRFGKTRLIDNIVVQIK